MPLSTSNLHQVLKFHPNKWVTALLWFFCFRNLWDYNLKWESFIKTTIYRERKGKAFNSDMGFL